MKRLLMLCALLGAAARAQDAGFDGVWINNDRTDFGMRRGDDLPLTPQWRKKSDALDKIRDAGGTLPANDSQCIPEGMPAMMQSGQLVFLVEPNFIQVFGGRGLQVRNLRLDKTRHTEDRLLFDSFGGESIAHWEGKVLVVDTIAIRPDAELIYALKVGKPHIVERMQRTGPDRLRIDTTVSDPLAFATPWHYVMNFTRDTRQGLQDTIYCIAAYDRSVNPQTGEQGFDLTPPPEEGVGVPQATVH